DTAIKEARKHLQPSDVDYVSMEGRIIERAKAARPRLIDEVSRGRSRSVLLAATFLAAAAAVALVVHRDLDPTAVEPSGAVSSDAIASSLRATEGVGEVRVGGVNAFSGHILRSGDLVEAEGVRAIFERPRKVTWILEHDAGVARARVKSAG